MLPFLAHPKRYTNTIIVKTELKYLQHEGDRWTRGWLEWLGKILFIFASGAAVLPLFVYMTEDRFGILLILIAVIYFFHLCVSVRTLLLASNAIGREKQFENWESLVLTGIDARRLILGKWWAVVKYVWKTHALSALLRLGLAYGVAQRLNSMGGTENCTGITAPFCYVSHNYPYSPVLLSNPLIPKVIIAGGLCLIFAMVELTFLVALGLFAALLVHRHNLMRSIVSLCFRATLIVCILSFLKLPLANGNYNNDAFHGALLTMLNQVYCIQNYGADNCKIQPDSSSVYHYSFALALEYSKFVITPLADSGTLITADLMRPFPVIGLFHILRDFYLSAISLLLFLAITWFCLRYAQILAVRQHALRPID